MLRLFAFAAVVTLFASGHVSPPAARDRPASGGLFCSSRVRGDFDGDRRPDIARVGSVRRGCGTRWTVVIRLGAGPSLVHSLDREVLPLEQTRMCSVGCTAFGAHDLDRDGRDELEVADATPATGDAVVVYRLFRGSLHPLRRRSGMRRQKLMLLMYTGSVTSGSWVVCRDRPEGRRVIQVGEGYGTRSDPRLVEVLETAYVVKGETFRYLSTRTYSRRSSRVGSPLPVPGRRC